MVNVVDEHFTHPPQLLSITWEEVADGFQIAGFVASELRNLHLEKACLLLTSPSLRSTEHQGNFISLSFYLMSGNSFPTCTQALTQMTPPLWQKAKRNLLMKVKEERERAGLKLNIRKLRSWYLVPSVQFSSVAHSCPTLCDPTDCSTAGFPVHHQLPELPQTHVHPLSDAIQPSHSLSSPSSPVFNLSQYQGLFQ